MRIPLSDFFGFFGGLGGDMSRFFEKAILARFDRA
jgi:hypothetical protein